MVKKLTLFSIRMFIGPFIVTFLISMFMLVLQFLWVYIDDLMGKGIEVVILLELLFYVSASLIPLALPLAILLSSIMTMGNLAEHNELTALKSAGLSLSRILRPLIYITSLIAIGTFYFSNYVIPVANYKWHSLIYDIQDTKVATLLKPGTYSRELDGFAIKVKSEKNNHVEGITIHDFRNTSITKTVKAESGDIYKSENGKYLLFNLKNGRISEELNTQAPIFEFDGRLAKSLIHNRPSRRTSFKVATYKMELKGFKLNRGDQNLFKDDFEMLNVFQIKTASDTVQAEYNKMASLFADATMQQHAYFQSYKFETDTVNEKYLREHKKEANMLVPIKSIQAMSQQEKLTAMNTVISRLTHKSEEFNSQVGALQMVSNKWDKFTIEFHRKFALTATIIVLFFVGAPLGAIVRKGGFGAPVVIAALLFMVYFVLMSIGESLASSNVLTPFWGMWLPSIILSPFAFLLMLSASNDLAIWDKRFWKKFRLRTKK